MIIGMGGISAKSLGFVCFSFIWLFSPVNRPRSPGPLFLKRLKEASKMSAKQTEVFQQLSATFTPETIERWGAMVAKWNSNPKARNPYQELKSSKSCSSWVQLILMAEIINRNNSPRCSTWVSKGWSHPGRPRQASSTQNQYIGVFIDRLRVGG
jgi:hypothetical protein